MRRRIQDGENLRLGIYLRLILSLENNFDSRRQRHLANSFFSSSILSLSFVWSLSASSSFLFTKLFSQARSLPAVSHRAAFPALNPDRSCKRAHRFSWLRDVIGAVSWRGQWVVKGEFWACLVIALKDEMIMMRWWCEWWQRW